MHIIVNYAVCMQLNINIFSKHIVQVDLFTPAKELSLLYPTFELFVWLELEMLHHCLRNQGSNIMGQRVLIPFLLLCVFRMVQYHATQSDHTVFVELYCNWWDFCYSCIIVTYCGALDIWASPSLAGTGSLGWRCVTDLSQTCQTYGQQTWTIQSGAWCPYRKSFHPCRSQQWVCTQHATGLEAWY